MGEAAPRGWTERRRCRLVGRQLAVGSWQLAVDGGWWWLAAVGGWRLVVGSSWQWLAVGGWSPLAVGGGWWLAVGGSWWLAVGGGPIPCAVPRRNPLGASPCAHTWAKRAMVCSGRTLTVDPFDGARFRACANARDIAYRLFAPVKKHEIQAIFGAAILQLLPESGRVERELQVHVRGSLAGGTAARETGHCHRRERV